MSNEDFETEDGDEEEDPNLNTGEDETPPGEGEGDDAETKMDLPTALEQLEDARRYIRKVNRESANRRHEIDELTEKLEQFTKTGDDATTQLKELQEKLAAANLELATLRMRDKFDEVAAKEKIAFVNPVAQRDAFGFAKAALVGLGNEVTDQDIADVIRDVIKSRPYLRDKPKPNNINSANKGTTDAIAGIDLDEIKRDFGLD
jgi:hypothetical protein